MIVLPIALWGCRRIRDDKTDYSDIRPDEVQRVVTLVHGTWPRGWFNLDAAVGWYDSKSLFCEALCSEGQPPTLVHRFKWSGANSVSARSDAAKELRNELTKTIEEHQTATHWIVAHSHGGDVALRALRDKSAANHLSGLVCLSTPFLAASIRPWVRPEPSDTVYFIFAMTLVLVPFGVGGGILWLASAYDWPSLLILAGVASYIISLGVLVMMLSKSQRHKFWLPFCQGAKDYAADLRTPHLPQKLLLVRAVADEASGVLTVAHVLSWVVGLIDTIAVMLPWPAIVLGIIVKTLTAWLGKWPTIGDSILFWGILVAVCSTLMVYLARSLLALPFGFRVSKFTPLLDISAEAAPSGGESTILQLPPLEMRGLRHSSTHESREVAKRASAWMSSPDAKS